MPCRIAELPYCRVSLRGYQLPFECHQHLYPLRKSYNSFNGVCFASPMAQDDGQGPGVASSASPPRRVLPPSHVGPPPPPPPQNLCHHRQIHASRPPSQRFHGVRPPAVPTVPMRAPAASSGGTSEDFQQIPCQSIPHPPPEAVPPCPSCIPGPRIPQRSPVARRRMRLRRWTGCRFGSTCAFPGHAVKSRFFRSGGCRLRWTLRTPFKSPDPLNKYTPIGGSASHP
jgi:hypothetical protein